MNIINWERCSDHQKDTLLQRPLNNESEIIFSKVKGIIREVRNKGDGACFKFTEKFDGVVLNKLEIKKKNIRNAQVCSNLAHALEIAKNNIIKVQAALFPKDNIVEVIPGMICQRVFRPLDSVGLYVPGGTAPLISTLMMLALPAKIAGCEQIIICTPPDKNGKLDPAMLYAAKICGIDRIFAIGGAQAIGAMAYGTETIPKVCKIFGPGNTWVTIAKQLVAQDPMGAATDLPAGPSELMVIADDNANEEIIASDLLSQAEHAPDSQVILCTNSMRIAESMNNIICTQLAGLSRKKIVEQALENSKILLVNKLETAIDIANQYCPEHLSLQCANSSQWITKIRNVGTLFLGSNTAESFGDYITGSNHVLPTYGTARSYSGLSVCDYLRSYSVQSLNDEAFIKMSEATMRIADAEGLTAHSNAIRVRLMEKEKIV